MKYILPIIWTITFFAFDNKPLGFTSTSPLYTHFTYNFAHANILHLLTNVIAYTYIHKITDKLNITKEATISSFLSAIAASFLIISDKPTVGASGFLYAMFAAMIAGVISGRMKITNKKQFATFYGSIALATALQPLVSHNINFAIHILSFTINIFLLFTYYKIRN